MIDRIKGGIEPQDVKEIRKGSIELLKEDKIMNPKNKPVVSFHRLKRQFVFDVAVPRCLFGNNLAEATDEDLDKIVLEIQEAFERNGLELPKEAIYNAKIYYLEYGKNIILPIDICLLALFKRLGKCLTKGYNAPEFHHYRKGRQDGYKVGVSNAGKDIGFYDKTNKEIVSKSKHNNLNKEIYCNLLKEGKQVLRYEVSFYGSSAVNSYLSKFKKCNWKFTLRDVWDSKLAYQVLVSCLGDVVNNLPPAGRSKETELRQIDQAIKQGVSASDILQYTGLTSLERRHGAYTIKEIFNPIEKRYGGQKARYGQYTEAKNKQKELSGYFKPRREYLIKRIVRTVNNFRPIRVDDKTNEVIDD